GVVVLPRRHILGAVVVLADVAARKDLIDLIRDEVPPARIDIRAVRRLARDPAQDADGVRPNGAAVLGTEVHQYARLSPVRLVCRRTRCRVPAARSASTRAGWACRASARGRSSPRCDWGNCDPRDVPTRRTVGRGGP